MVKVLMIPLSSVDAELGEVLTDVVDDLFELAVELEGFGDEAVVGTGHGDRGLGPAGDDHDIVRSETHHDGLDPTLPLHDVCGEDTGRGGAAAQLIR